MILRNPRFTLWPIRPPLSLEREQRLSKAPGQRQYVILHRALKSGFQVTCRRNERAANLLKSPVYRTHDRNEGFIGTVVSFHSRVH